MDHRNPTKRRFQITRLEERVAPAPAAVLIPSISQVGENVRGFHGAQNACPGLHNAAEHSGNPILEIQKFRHGCECDCSHPPEPTPSPEPSPMPEPSPTPEPNPTPDPKPGI